MWLLVNRVKNLSLHAKTTISVSFIVIAALMSLYYLYSSTANRLVEEENRRQAEIIAAQLAQHLSSEQMISNIAALRNDALYYKRLHEAVLDIRIYGLTKTGMREVATIPLGEPEELPREALASLRQGKLFSHVEAIREGVYIIRAAAPIENAGQAVGAVALRTQTSYYSPLLGQLNRVTLLAMLLAIAGITVSLYFLFRRFVYNPIEDALAVMQKAERGELEVEAPVRSRDEIGLLCLGLNTMLARIRQMTTELENEQKRLADRVRQATGELSERNLQLQQANLELFAIQRQLLQMERLAAAGQLAAQVAHEVGTPLNLISGHIQLLRSRPNDDDATRRFDIIFSQIERIEKIVRRLLDSTRRPKPDLMPINLEEVLQQVIEIAAPTLKSRNIELVAELDPNLPQVKGSPEQLQQVFINLIDNSLDAMPHGGRLLIKTRPADDGHVVIECDDTGVGMSPEVLSRVFEPFFTTKPEGLGSGLGLSIARQIIREHGGDLSIESAPDRGTQIIIKLPSFKEPQTSDLGVRTESSISI